MAYLPTGKELIDPFHVLEEAGIRQEMRVADFGCGTLGHYVFPAAKMVGPRGKVFAVDILKSVLSGVESRIKMESATNVAAVWGDIEREGGVNLPDSGSVDLGLLINNLFLSHERLAMLKECTRLVRPGGTMVIVDWKTTGSTFGPDASVRVSPEEARHLAEAAGLNFVKEFTPGQYHYGLIFTKP